MRIRSKSLFSLALCISAAAASAQVLPNEAWLPQTSDTNRPGSTQEKTQSQSQNFSSSKDLVGANVKDSQGNKVGDISELLINPRTGEAFASIGVDGGRYAVIPIQALNVNRPGGVLRNAEVTLNTSKESLRSGPTLARNEWQQLDSPSFVQSIYRHYNVQQPSAMGGSESQSGSMSGAASETDSSKEEKHDKKRDKSSQ